MILLGNLDCEWRMAQAQAARSLPALPHAVRQRLSLFGTLLRIHAEPGDELLLPTSVSPRCMRAVPGVPTPILGVLPGTLPDAPWRVAWCPPGAAAQRTNARSFSFHLARRLGVLLPGTQLLETPAALGRAAFPAGPWVFKAAYAVAGRDHVHGSGGPPAPDVTRRIQRLIDAQGPGVLEPWVPRIEDFGYGSDAGVHGLEVDARGAFRGITVPGPSLDPAFEEAIDHTRAAVEHALRAEGHVGPYGIDAWTYRTAEGRAALHALGEVNARMTFGHVASAWCTRVGTRLWGPDAAMALRFGERAEDVASGDILPLVGAADEPVCYAWLERLPA